MSLQSQAHRGKFIAPERRLSSKVEVNSDQILDIDNAVAGYIARRGRCAVCTRSIPVDVGRTSLVECLCDRDVKLIDLAVAVQIVIGYGEVDLIRVDGAGRTENSSAGAVPAGNVYAGDL